MYIHDVVAVARGVDDVLDRLPELLVQRMGVLLSHAWAVDREAWLAHRGELQADELTPPDQIDVEVGEPRVTLDSTIVPLSWQGPGPMMVPGVEVDLEVVSGGEGTTHLHVMGCYELPGASLAGADVERLGHRVVVVGMRRLLHLMARSLEQDLTTATATTTEPEEWRSWLFET